MFDFAVFDPQRPAVSQGRRPLGRAVDRRSHVRRYVGTQRRRADTAPAVTPRRYPHVPDRAKWLTQPRRRLFAALERIRLDGRPAALRAAAERLQARLMSEKYRAALVAADGTRRAYVPFDRAYEGLISFSARDTLISVGSSWTYLEPAHLQEP